MRYLKQINKEIAKRDMCYQEYQRHNYIAKQLLADFDKQYNKTKTEGDTK